MNVEQIDLPKNLNLNTPCCGWPVPSVPLMTVATEVADRRCPRCKTEYRVIVRPLGRTAGGGVISQVEWNR